MKKVCKNCTAYINNAYCLVFLHRVKDPDTETCPGWQKKEEEKEK